jgi:hypothetical protein
VVPWSTSASPIERLVAGGSGQHVHGGLNTSYQRYCALLASCGARAALLRDGPIVATLGTVRSERLYWRTRRSRHNRCKAATGFGETVNAVLR